MEDRPKKPTAPGILSQVPRKDPYDESHGSGDPHMNWDDKPLSESETWRSHKSHGTVRPKKRE